MHECTYVHMYAYIIAYIQEVYRYMYSIYLHTVYATNHSGENFHDFHRYLLTDTVLPLKVSLTFFHTTILIKYITTSLLPYECGVTDTTIHKIHW